jgi:UDP-galactopyranose mutase
MEYSLFNGYRHRKGVIIDNQLFSFPITRSAVDRLPKAEQVARELSTRPTEIDRTNFETACLSIFGPTLYGYFISNYTRKMWGIAPAELSAHWAPDRLELRDEETDELFKQEWQGLPVDGYSVWLERMIEGIPVETGVEAMDARAFDMVVSTARIDETAGWRHGRLAYRSLRFTYATDETWEDDRYGTINLPQHSRFIRKCNFKVLHRQPRARSLIQYQEPQDASDGRIPMYPVHTGDNEQLFRKYLSHIVSLPNLCPAGRLGLFEYFDMDEAVSCAMKLVPIVEGYRDMPPQKRMDELMKLRKFRDDEAH